MKAHLLQISFAHCVILLLLSFSMITTINLNYQPIVP